MSPLQKQNLTVNFDGDLDSKTDPLQVGPGNFATFNNAVRTVGKRLTKRNGYQILASFSSPFATSLSVFNGSLVGLGSSVSIFAPEVGSIGSLINRGAFQPVSLTTMPAIRNSASQTSADVAIAPNGLACVISGDSQAGLIYQVIEVATGNIIAPITQLNSSATNGRVFILGGYFFMVYYTSGTNLVYAAVPYDTPAGSPTTGNISGPTMHSNVYDGYTYNGLLYLAWNSTDNTNKSYRLVSVNPSFAVSSATVTNTTQIPFVISVTVDTSQSPAVIWVSEGNFDGTSITKVTAAAFNTSLSNILGNTTIYTDSVSTSTSLLSLVTIATGQLLTAIFGEVVGGAVLVYTNYAFGLATCTQGGTVTGGYTNRFSYNLLLAGKPFINPTNSSIYFLAFFQSGYQPSYFVLDTNNNIVAKLAYSNGGTPDALIQSSPNQSGSQVNYAYLYIDQISPVNKSQGAPASGAAVFNQSGTNIVTFTFNQSNILGTQIGSSLALSGGFLWMYDGEKPVELGFHIWPNNITATADMGGSMTLQQYYYQVTYEWTDGAGIIHRSAPSIPVGVNLSGSNDAVTLILPVLGFTAKAPPNPVRIVVYRWSTGNPDYTQVSSLTNAAASTNQLVINTTAGGTISFTDYLADSSIEGNNLLYTTGGVIEDIGGPASQIMTLFDDRLWLLDAEDPNLWWFSKQVIEGTPVEMSDLLTYYVAPTIASQASTGPITAAAPMDDKLIMFKSGSIYYINGTGPDNTGANNQYSQPIFITAAVGCDNQKSIALTPDGLMFQSGQGIWLLGRDLSTSYIGSPVESYNSYAVTSAVSIPNTTQIRFTLSNGTELIYDYFYGKWDTATPPTAISGVIYQGLHTLLDSSGNIWQEDPGSYLDNTSPVNLSFTTPWYNLAGLQGYERAYYAYLLGTYVSPHILTVQIYYDYASTPSQTVVLNPNSNNPNGTGPTNSLEQFRIFFKQQKCQAVKFSVTESFDSTFGGTAGAGLTLSGINFVLGIKKSYKPIAAFQSAG